MLTNGKPAAPGNVFHYAGSFALSFCAVVAVFCDRHTVVGDTASLLEALNGINVLSVVLFALLAGFFNKILRITNRRVVMLALVGAAVIAFTVVLGFYIRHYDSFGNIAMNPYFVSLNLIVFVGYTALFYCILTVLFSWLIDPERQLKQGMDYAWFGANKKSFFLLTAVFVVCWMPYFLAYYPGIVNYDTYDQIGQGQGAEGYQLNNHHPVAHTLLMSLFINLGRSVSGRMDQGIALFTAVQMICMAAVFSFIILYMARRRINTVIRVAATLFFAAFPGVAVYAVTALKDVWLGLSLLLYVIFLIELVINRENFFCSKTRLLLFVLTILCVLFFKNVGIFIFMVTLPFIFLVAKRYWKRLLVIAACCITVFGIVKGPVFDAYQIRDANAREAYSLPLQQIARIVRDHGAELTDEDRRVIGEILPYDDLPALYNPRISDGVKGVFNTEAFDRDKTRYIRRWASLAGRFPKTAILSALSGSLGYWYPEYSESRPLSWPDTYYDWTRLVVELGWEPYDPMLMRYTDPNLFPAFRAFSNEILLVGAQKIQIVSTLCSMAGYYLAAFVGVLICILKKRYKLLLPIIVIFVVWLTNIASPLAFEFRYAWPAVLCVPVITAFLLQDTYYLTQNMAKKDNR